MSWETFPDDPFGNAFGSPEPLPPPAAVPAPPAAPPKAPGATDVATAAFVAPAPAVRSVTPALPVASVAVSPVAASMPPLAAPAPPARPVADVGSTNAFVSAPRSSSFESVPPSLGAMQAAPARPSRSEAASLVSRPSRILEPGLCLTLRPMVYPTFFEMYRAAIKNTWTVEEVDFSTDVGDLHKKMTDAERHLVQRLVAFFATGDSIVANNLVLNLYKHINAPEARMYLSRQLYEEALHVQFYLTLLDTYVPDPNERAAAFAAVENIPSIQKKAEFCMRWLDATSSIDKLETKAQRKQFLLNLICFAACIEGLFFFGAFAYVYFLRSKGMLHGLAAGTNWVFRDESAHMAFAFEVVNTVRREEPELFDAEMEANIAQMLDDAIACETQFAEDLLGGGVAGLSVGNVQQYLQFCADQRLATLGMSRRYNVKNPLSFMDLQDVQEVTNFFERRVSAYQVGVTGDVALDMSF